MRGRPGFAADWYQLGAPAALDYSLAAYQDGRVGAGGCGVEGGGLGRAGEGWRAWSGGDGGLVGMEIGVHGAMCVCVRTCVCVCVRVCVRM